MVTDLEEGQRTLAVGRATILILKRPFPKLQAEQPAYTKTPQARGREISVH